MWDPLIPTLLYSSRKKQHLTHSLVWQMTSISGDHSQMCVPDKGGAPPVDLLPVISMMTIWTPTSWQAVMELCQFHWDLGENITVSMEEHTVPLAGLTQAICWEKHTRRTYLEACVAISPQPLRSPEPGPFLTTALQGACPLCVPYSLLHPEESRSPEPIFS